ncbi:MAG: ABC transporter substrate-binding protein [Clostridia bacterium]|nr:ABC transporter substrate-binding protein [Clostridia bacterium]
MKKLFCIILMFSLLFSGCSKDEKQEVKETAVVESDDWKYGGSIQLACVPVDTLNPLITKHASVSDFLSLIYEGLFECNADHTTVPVLASSCSASKNNTVYTVKLKSGIKFHDGSTLTSDDVVATLDYIFLYEGNYKSLKNNILLYHATSEDTVSITLKKPIADFANCLDFPILPAKLTGDDFLEENSNFRPVGTGMYRYDRAEDYKSIYLKQNSSWHNEKKPYISEVNVQILSDADTIIAAFDAGIIDVVTTSWTTPSDINLTSSIYNTFKTEQNRFTYVGINCACADFDTVEERRYLSSAVDGAQIADDIMLDNAVVAKAPLRDSVYFNIEDDSPKSSEKISKPKSDEDDSEVILLYNSDSKTKERLAHTLKYQLENKGYSVSLDAKPFDEYVLKVLKCEYDLYVGEINIDNSGNLDFMFGESRSAQNICAYRSEELYNFISNLNSATSKDSRAVVWNNFKKYYSETVFQIPLYFSDGCTYVNNQVSGELSPNLSKSFSGFENLYVNTSKNVK